MTTTKDVDVEIDEEEISGTVRFDVLDENRLVKPLMTATFILVIRKWLEELKGSNSDDYEIWKYRCMAILPENEGDVLEGRKYCEIIVNENYRLLKPNNWLTFDQALFILLGLNAIDLTPVTWGYFTMYKYENGLDKSNEAALKDIFYSTPHFQYLSRSTFVKDGMITSDNLITLALQENLFTQGGIDYILNKKSKPVKDIETGIPFKRLDIYKSTLPSFLKKLPAPLSVRALTIHSNEQTDGIYTKNYKSKLNVGGSTIKKEISKIIKTSWWKGQPLEIQNKINRN